MATWQTPITDWDGVTEGRKYYNFGDLDRVEQNTEYLKDEFESIGYTADTTTFVYPRTRASFNQYDDDLNRIENNILAIKDASWLPLTWEPPFVSWASVQQGFGYDEANRLEKNLFYLKEMLDNVKESFIPCGDTFAVCGSIPPLL